MRFHLLFNKLSSLTAFLLTTGLLFSCTGFAAQNSNFPIGETGLLGSLNSNDFSAVGADDGVLEKIAEQKDGNGNYRIEWIWRFNVVGTSDSLHLEAQATNSKRGMDYYDFSYWNAAENSWQPLGTLSQTRMTSHAWPMAGISGAVDIKVTDTNQANDGKRANQLWIDYLYIQSTGEVSTPLGAPSDLSAQAVSESEIQLTWSDNASSETGFLLERTTCDGNNTFGIDLGPDSSSHLDTGLAPQTCYSYQVQAYDAGTNSAFSNTASASTTNTTGGHTGPATDKIIAGYFPAWGIYNARKYWVSYIPFDRITHVNYAFANVDPASLQVIIGDTFADETNNKDPETANGLPAGNLHQLTHYRDSGHNGPAFPHLKIIISVGGWSWSENFSDAALTPESRWRFAESLKNFVATYQLDGADLDWEYPTGDTANCGEQGNVCRPQDPVNHALLIMACRAKLDELGPGMELSIAMAAGYGTIAAVMPPIVDNSLLVDADKNALVYMRNPNNPVEQSKVETRTAAEMLDYVHIMNYDMVSAYGHDTTRHHAPLYGYEGSSGDPAAAEPAKNYLLKFNSHYAVQSYRHVHSDYAGFNPDAGDPRTEYYVAEIPASKLTFGVPMYGRGFKSVDAGAWDGYPGLFQFTDDSTRRRVPKGTWDGGKWGNTGVFSYWDILLNFGGDAGSPAHDIRRVGPPDAARPYGPYVLSGDLFIGFDDRDSLTDKMIYLTDQDMGGVMFWDFPGDISQAQVDQGIAGAGTSYPEKSLIHHVAETLEALFPPTPD
jgi:chitinase